MRIEYLEYLLAVADAPSISVAAQKLYISQTALSAAIRAVENELHTEIFQRTSKGVRLTERGEQILAVSAEILEKYRGLFPGGEPMRSSLSVGVYVYDYNALSKLLLRRLREEGMTLQLSIYELKENEVVSRVADGDSDIGVGLAFADRHEAYAALALANGLRFEVLCQNRAYLYVPANSALAGQKSVRIRDLQEERFITAANCIKPFKDAGLHKRLPDYCVLSNIASVIESIEENGTVTLLPQRAMRSNEKLLSGAIRQVEVEDLPSIATHYLVCRADDGSAPERLVLETLREFYRT